MINKVHCLFEQSGTFKNEFKKLGYDAKDYDILDEFGETDCIVDLFSEISRAFEGGESIFDTFSKDDIIMAFFPCTRFETQITLAFKGESYQMKNWDIPTKLKYSMKLHDELHELYELFCKMYYIFETRGLKAIIENPATQPHYLTTYFCVKPTFIDNDRTQRGDYYKKPTQYWFINRKPSENFIFEPLYYVRTKTIVGCASEDVSRKTIRSMIHPQYANRFIREFILDEEQGGIK